MQRAQLAIDTHRGPVLAMILVSICVSACSSHLTETLVRTWTITEASRQAFLDDRPKSAGTISLKADRTFSMTGMPADLARGVASRAIPDSISGRGTLSLDEDRGRRHRISPGV